MLYACACDHCAANKQPETATKWRSSRLVSWVRVLIQCCQKKSKYYTKSHGTWEGVRYGRKVFGWTNQDGRGMWHAWDRKGVHTFFVAKSGCKKPLRRPRCRWNDNTETGFEDRMSGHRLDSAGWGQGLSAGCCKHGNEPSGSVKCGWFLDWLRNACLSRRTLIRADSVRAVRWGWERTTTVLTRIDALWATQSSLSVKSCPQTAPQYSVIPHHWGGPT